MNTNPPAGEPDDDSHDDLNSGKSIGHGFGNNSRRGRGNKFHSLVCGAARYKTGQDKGYVPSQYQPSRASKQSKQAPKGNPPQPAHNPRKQSLQVMVPLNPSPPTPPPLDPLLITLLEELAGKSDF